VRKNIDLNSWSKILVVFYVIVILVIIIKYRTFPLKTPSIAMPLILFALNSMIPKRYNFTVIVMGLLIIDSLVLIAYLFS
jgi:hypothetical protein